MLSKIEEKKTEKEKKIIEASYSLFLEKGINNTSIQDIAEKAGIAKGTFYLYFNDKYQLQERVITEKSRELFKNAVLKLQKENINSLDDEIIFIVDHVINLLVKEPKLINFLSKDLSLGAYGEHFTKIASSDEIGIQEAFNQKLKEDNIKLQNKEVTFFMIIELVSATCFSSILYNKPLPIEEFKPYLYKTIRKIVKD